MPSRSKASIAATRSSTSKRKIPFDPEGRLAQRRAHPHHAGRRTRGAPDAVRRAISPTCPDAADHAADSRAHPAAARRADRRRLLLRRRTAALRFRRADSRRRATPRWPCASWNARSEVLATAEFTHDGLEAALRGAAEGLGIKAGQMFEPIRVAVCGRKTAPPLFGTLEVLGRDTCLKRIGIAPSKS